jgi:hypothetical protein
MSLKRIALLVALITLPGTEAFAQASNYYEVPDAITNSQDLDGVAAANPGVYDGAHFDVDTYGADQGGGVLQMELRMYRDADWEDPIVFNDFYEDFLVTGLAGETDHLKLMSQDGFDQIGCNVRTLRLKNLRLEEAVAIVNNDFIGDPSGFGCIAPVDFWVSGTASEPGLITFDDGGLVINRRDLLTFYGLTVHARTGDNFLEKPGDISGQPLQIQVDPASSLQIRPDSGATRIRAAQNISVDNGELSIVPGPAAADVNLIWGELSRPGQDLVLQNTSVFRVGDSATTLRVGFEFVPGEGVQVDGSTLDVTSFATLSSPLVLRNGLVEVAENGHLVASRVHSTGNSTVRADAAALDTSIDRLDVPGGLLTLDGGQFVLAGDNPPIVGTLQLGASMGGVEILVPDTSIVSNPIVPDRELSFDPGGRLTGQGRIEMRAAHHAVAINGGATLAPGLSVGSLSLVGQLFMEDGASVEMEIDTGVLLAGGQIASDTVDLGSPYGDLWLGLGGGTQLQLSILNDTALPEGSRARLFSYPLPARWNGQTFAGLPNGAVFQQGANLWQIRYDDPLVPGLEDIVPTRLVSLTVVAPHLQVLPSPLVNAGAASVGQPASPVTVTLRNAGVVPIDITTLAALRLDGGGPNADFAFLSDLCTGTTLLANQVCTFDVQMTPSQAGTDVAVFEVNGTDEGRFIGEGVPSGGSVTLDPPIRDFGDLAVLDNSVQVFTLTNGSAVDLPSLTLVVHQLAADYTLQADTCTGSLAAGASCTFEIRFQPASTGVLTGIVDVRESGVTAVQAALLGRGLDTSLDVTPSPLAFGDQEVGTSSTPQAVTI